MNLPEICLLCLWNTSWFNGLRLKIQCDKFILDFMTKKHFYISALALIMGGASVACSDDESTTYVTYQHPYSNPLTDYSAADPTVLKENDHSFYVYCTNTWQALHSADLVNWTKCDQNLFEKRPSFVTGSGVSVWAPDIEKIGDKYVLYYAMSAMGKPENAAIGTAYSDSPQGPFKLDKSRDGKGLLFTSKEIDVRNSIDPCFFEEDGKKWLFWGSFNGIYAVQLSDDGMNVLNGDVEKMLGHYPSFYDGNHNAFYNMYFDINKKDKQFLVTYDADSLIYCYDTDFQPLYSFGFAGENVKTDYKKISVEAFVKARGEFREKYTYYHHLKYLSELDMLFRSYTRPDDEKQDGLQIYQGKTLLADVSVPKKMYVLGYSAPYVYATSGLDEMSESFALYRFKIK